MSFPAIQLCELSEVLPMCVKQLGIADGNSPEGGSVAAGAPYTLAQIKKFIFQSDFEINWMIVGNLEHPYRTNFVTGETDWLADGALVPAHLGAHSRVMVKNDYGGEEFEELGKARDFSRIKRIKEKSDIFGSPVNLYAIFGGRIHFADDQTVGKLDIPVVEKDLTLTTLAAPLAYFWAVIAGAIVKAAMPGFPDAHRRYWSDWWRLYVGDIKNGAVAIPEPEQLERIGT